MIESWGSLYYNNFGGKFYALLEFYLAPKGNYVCPAFVEISKKKLFGVDYRVIKNKFVVQWRTREMLDAVSTSTSKDAGTNDASEDKKEEIVEQSNLFLMQIHRDDGIQIGS
ncbi:hypothetical protein AMTRI_Chr08g205700 [Amborella trichopoda]